MIEDFEQQIAGIASLNDPIRRSLYRLVIDSAEPVGREQAATAVGVQKTLAAFHLDRLVDAGLLTTEFRRLTGRTGPGAGRPAKLYRRSDQQIEVSLPAREYNLAGRLLAEAIALAETNGRGVRAELQRVSSAFGRLLGEEAVARAGKRPSRATQREALLEVLRNHGFEPRTDDGEVVLANCPFHTLAQQFTDVVCGMNLHLMTGLRSALDLGESKLEPKLQPEPGQCCVRFCNTAA